MKKAKLIRLALKEYNKWSSLHSRISESKIKKDDRTIMVGDLLDSMRFYKLVMDANFKQAIKFYENNENSNLWKWQTFVPLDIKDLLKDSHNER